jgi:hypothetical protein
VATVHVDEAALKVLVASPAGEVGRYMAAGGAAVASSAQRRAPVDTGHLQSVIGWQLDSDGAGLYVDVFSPAQDERGTSYGYLQNLPYLSNGAKTTPHLVPALVDWPQP